jgi:hypothetical protein
MSSGELGTIPPWPVHHGPRTGAVSGGPQPHGPSLRGFPLQNYFIKSNVDADVNATAIVPDAETKCFVVVNITSDELPRCTAAATTETTTGTPPHSATYVECAEPMRSRFGALFQLWHEWSSHPTMPQQVVCY